MINFLKRILGLSNSQVNYAEMIAQGAIILDVRTKEEFAGGHVKGAINIPLNQLSNHLNKFTDKEKPIITCCASGMRSASAKNILKEKGYTQVHNGGSWLSVQNNL